VDSRNARSVPSLENGFVMSDWYKTLPAEGEPLIATRHPDIVHYFQDYYDAIW